jgi:hypothetical protein
VWVALSPTRKVRAAEDITVGPGPPRSGLRPQPQAEPQG